MPIRFPRRSVLSAASQQWCGHKLSSTVLRNDYNAISALAHQTQEPIYITKNGEGDVVVMSVSAFEEREQQLKHRADILEVEFSRLNGEPTYSTKQARDMLKEKYRHAKVQD